MVYVFQELSKCVGEVWIWWLSQVFLQNSFVVWINVAGIWLHVASFATILKLKFVLPLIVLTFETSGRERDTVAHIAMYRGVVVFIPYSYLRRDADDRLSKQTKQRLGVE